MKNKRIVSAVLVCFAVLICSGYLVSSRSVYTENETTESSAAASGSSALSAASQRSGTLRPHNEGEAVIGDVYLVPPEYAGRSGGFGAGETETQTEEYPDSAPPGTSVEIPIELKEKEMGEYSEYSELSEYSFDMDDAHLSEKRFWKCEIKPRQVLVSQPVNVKKGSVFKMLFDSSYIGDNSYGFEIGVIDSGGNALYCSLTDKFSGDVNFGSFDDGTYRIFIKNISDYVADCDGVFGFSDMGYLYR